MPHLSKNNVIYSIPCKDCQSQYIGMTRNKLKTRLYGHQSNVNKLESLLESGHTYSDQAVLQLSEKTALIEHCVSQEHRFALEKAEIVDQTFHAHALPMLECFHIYNTPQTVNRRTDTEGINSSYAGILHTLRNNQRKQPPVPCPPTHSPSTISSQNQNTVTHHT